MFVIDVGDESVIFFIEGGVVDKSGIFMDDFMFLGFGVCKFIGLFYLYSFFFKYI